MERLATIFGRRLRALRTAAGMTQEQLGRAATVDSKHISGMERGVNVPSFESVERLARALGADYYELFLPDRIDVGRQEQPLKLLVRELERQASPAARQFLVQVLTAVRDLEAGRRA